MSFSPAQVQFPSISRYTKYDTSLLHSNQKFLNVQQKNVAYNQIDPQIDSYSKLRQATYDNRNKSQIQYMTLSADFNNSNLNKASAIIQNNPNLQSIDSISQSYNNISQGKVSKFLRKQDHHSHFRMKNQFRTSNEVASNHLNNKSVVMMTYGNQVSTENTIDQANQTHDYNMMQGYEDELDSVALSNINKSFNKIFTQKETVLQVSEKHIQDYVQKRAELFLNKMTKRFLVKKNRFAHLMQPPKVQLTEKQVLNELSMMSRNSGKNNQQSNQRHSSLFQNQKNLNHSIDSIKETNVQSEQSPVNNDQNVQTSLQRSITFYNRQEMAQQRYQDFKLKVKEDLMKDSVENGYGSKEDQEDIDKPLFENQTQDKVEFKRFIRLQKEGLVNIREIVAKNAERRTVEEKNHLLCFLKFRVPFFENYEKDLIFLMVERLEPKHFKPKDISEVGIYVNEEETCVAVLKDSKVFGERALENDDKRGATIIAHYPTLCLVLYKKDYKEIIYDWSYIKLLDLNNFLNEQKYQPNEIIYEIGSDPEVFYIIRSGKVILETIIEIEDFHKYPIVINILILMNQQANKEWEILKTKKRLLYRMKELKNGEIFGHDELLLDIKRRCRVRATTVCEIIYINKEEFFQAFPKNEIIKMRQETKDLDLNYLVEKITRQYANKKTLRLIRLYPWLEKARSNKTKSEKILKELAKVKLLQTFQEKVRITDENYEDMKLYEKRIARFVDKDSLDGIQQEEVIRNSIKNSQQNQRPRDLETKQEIQKEEGERLTGLGQYSQQSY
ncbi:UNKNOWN [Stylonychia lemnae]|uniref:Cyclic nucleotide-binding domain-containing protein n=1 Tax=Stylonychia lemnae TaxID=5949 RepID=A0A078B0X0_STYLE|nr:UNKNOWN [Stylonychia lemnae]|eukprot:CDW88204.1 UNKNOWN [Stylonychia lemnae]